MSPAPRAPDPSRLDVTVTEGERCHRSVEVVIPADFVAAEQVAVIRKYARKVRLKGFRKGRAPTGVILQHYGREIQEESVDRAIQKACRQAIDSHGLRPVSEVEVADLRFGDEDGALSFKASFEVHPEVTIGRLGGFKLQRAAPAVPDGAADEILERLRKERAAWRTVENGRPESGDSVTVLLTQLDSAPDPDSGDGARQYDLVLGEGQALPDIEEAIRSLAAGEADEFDVAFPDDHPDGDRAGTRHRLKIELVSRRVPELPALDDAFARSVGDFDDLDVLRARIGEDLDMDARSRSEADFRERLLRMVVEANPFDVPDSMVSVYTDALLAEAGDLEESKLEELREELRPSSEFAVRRELIVERIVEEHDLRASPEEVGEKVRELADRMGQSPSAVRSRLRKSGGLDNIERQLTDAKLFEFLMARSDLS